METFKAIGWQGALIVASLVAFGLCAWVIARAERRRREKLNRSIWLTDFWSRDCRPSGSMYTVGRDVKGK